MTLRVRIVRTTALHLSWSVAFIASRFIRLYIGV
jgi:hypothetical protein